MSGDEAAGHLRQLLVLPPNRGGPQRVESDAGAAHVGMVLCHFLSAMHLDLSMSHHQGLPAHRTPRCGGR